MKNLVKKYLLLSTILIFLFCNINCIMNKKIEAVWIVPPENLIQFQHLKNIQLTKPHIKIEGIRGEEIDHIYQDIICNIIKNQFQNNKYYRIFDINYDFENSEINNDKDKPSSYIHTFARIYFNENDKNLYTDSEIKITIKDISGNEKYSKIFKELSFEKKLDTDSQISSNTLHNEIGLNLFQDAVSFFVSDISPHEEKKIFMVNRKGDQKSIELLHKCNFYEAANELIPVIKKNEKKFINIREKIFEKYKKRQKWIKKYVVIAKLQKKLLVNLSKEQQRTIQKNQNFLSPDYENYAIANQALGYHDQAIRFYEKAILADPYNKTARDSYNSLIYFRKATNTELDFEANNFDSLENKLLIADIEESSNNNYFQESKHDIEQQDYNNTIKPIEKQETINNQLSNETDNDNLKQIGESTKESLQDNEAKENIQIENAYKANQKININAKNNQQTKNLDLLLNADKAKIIPEEKLAIIATGGTLKNVNPAPINISNKVASNEKNKNIINRDILKGPCRLWNDNPKQKEIEKQNIINTLDNWAKSWSNKDLKKYLSFYDKEFKPQKKMSKKKWKSTRRHKLNKKTIKITIIDKPVIVFDSCSRAKIHFEQKYESTGPSYSDYTTKLIILKKRKAKWFILEEISL